MAQQPPEPEHATTPSPADDQVDRSQDTAGLRRSLEGLARHFDSRSPRYTSPDVEFGPADPATTRRYMATTAAEWLAADDAAAAATLRALADKIERGEVIGYYVARHPERFPVRPNGVRYRIEIATDMPPDADPASASTYTAIDVGLAASLDDCKRFAGWSREQVFVVDKRLEQRLAGLIVRNVYVTNDAAERLTPKLLAYLRHQQLKHYPHGVIRTLSGGRVD